MTSVEFLKLCLRRWYVLLTGLVVTAAASFLAAGPNVVYAVQTTVNILDPDRGNVRIVGFHSPDSIAVAHILVARVNNGVKTPLASSPDVELSAMGIRSGTYAQVRNIGGQWLSQVTEPVVEVQSVAATPEQAKAQLDRSVADVRQELVTLEDQLKVPSDERFELQLTPAKPVVAQEISPRSRALLAYGLAGTGLTLCAVALFDRWANRRAARRRATA